MASKTPSTEARGLRPSHLHCRWCDAADELVGLVVDPSNRYFRVCPDVRACHRRFMRPKLRVLPGGARY